MSDNNKVDFSVLQPFKSFDTLRIGDYEWSLYPLSVADYVDGELLQFNKFAGEGIDPVNISSEFLRAISLVLWVLLRKGAPGMTVDAMTKGEWNSTPVTIMQMVPLMLNGEIITNVLLVKHGFTVAAEVINPSPASPSAAPVAGSHLRGRTRKSKLAG